MRIGTALFIASATFALLASSASAAPQTLFYDPASQGLSLKENGPGQPIFLVVDGGRTQIFLENAPPADPDNTNYNVRISYYKNTIAEAKEKHVKIAICTQCDDKPVKIILTSLPGEVPPLVAVVPPKPVLPQPQQTQPKPMAIQDALAFTNDIEEIQSKLAGLSQLLQAKNESTPSTNLNAEKHVPFSELIDLLPEAMANEPAANPVTSNPAEAAATAASAAQ